MTQARATLQTAVGALNAATYPVAIPKDIRLFFATTCRQATLLGRVIHLVTVTLLLYGTLIKVLARATSCCPADPRESMALIAEPGQESRWVKPGAKLGYLLVEEILSGSMVYRDGEKLLTLNVDINAVEADHRAQVSPPPAPEKVDRYAKGPSEPTLAKIVKSPERRTIPSERNRPKFHRLGPTR